MKNKDILKLQNAGNIPSLSFNPPKVGTLEWFKGLHKYDPYWRDYMIMNINEGLNQIKPFFNPEQTSNNQTSTDINQIEEQYPVQKSTTYVNVPKYEIDLRERAKANTILEHNEQTEQYKKLPFVKVPEWFSLLQETAPDNPIYRTFLNKMYNDIGKRNYEEKYNEHISKHPLQTGAGIGYNPYMGIQYNPSVQQQQEAHDYAVKESGYIGDKSTEPYKATDEIFGNVAIGAASMIPMFGASAGVLGTIPKIAADVKFGYDGLKNLVSPDGVVKTINFAKQGRYGRALRSGAWDLLDLALVKQGVRGINSFGKYAADVAYVAKFNIWNKANKIRMEYPWQRKMEVLPDLYQSASWTKPTFNTSLPLSPNRLLLAYKQGGILKRQKGGLIYKPFVPESDKEKIMREAIYADPETVSYEPEETSEPFQIEPVRIYSQRVTRKPIISEEEPTMQEVETQVDDTRVEKSVTEGKIYKSAEKQQFKEDLYNAYLKALEENLEALKKKGMKEKDIEEFAKKLATQDILESNWGQSSLSKNFNFGGIKDFSGRGTVKDTTEVVDGKAVRVKQPFRKFEDIDEYVNYKINLVDRKWNVFSADPSKYYTLIVSGKQKYATDPNYTSKLNNLYKQIWK